jgi:hypothetical protein
MPQNSAERQAAYRARRATAGINGNGDRRLDMWVTTEADLALARLAWHYGVTKRVMLEKLITSKDHQMLRKLDPDTEAWDIYMNITR